MPADPRPTVYACRFCGRSDRLYVEAKLWVHVVPDEQDPENDFQTIVDMEGPDGDHDWGNSSAMVCQACKHHGKAIDFFRRA